MEKNFFMRLAIIAIFAVLANTVNAQITHPGLCYKSAFATKSATYECGGGITIMVTGSGMGDAYDQSCANAAIMAGIMADIIADENLRYAMSYVQCPPPRSPELPEPEPTPGPEPTPDPDPAVIPSPI